MINKKRSKFSSRKILNHVTSYILSFKKTDKFTPQINCNTLITIMMQNETILSWYIHHHNHAIEEMLQWVIYLLHMSSGLKYDPVTEP